MSQLVWGDETKHFYDLRPDNVLDAAESLGLKTTGRVLTLNSMENRVYEVEIELDSPTDNPSERFKIFKFYRPGRWAKDQIQDEHDFLWDLKDHELTVIAPDKFDNQTIFENAQNIYFSCFPKLGGRLCDEWTDDRLEQMGRLLARLHNIGKVKKATHRIELNLDSYGYKNLNYLLLSDKISAQYRSSYETIANSILKTSEILFKNISMQRVHGDCHHGNTLLGSKGLFLIDFDDMVMGPKVQDIWLVTPGRDEYSTRQRNILLDSYQSMSEFDQRELKLIEPLRALRMIHFSSWIAHRIEDQSFQRVFSNFGTDQYWEKELFDLKQQLSLIQESLYSY